VTVEEVNNGLRVRQNRFWERGRPSSDHDKIIWYVAPVSSCTGAQAYIDNRKIPLAIATSDEHGTNTVNDTYILREREAILDVDPTRPFKLNSGTSGFCKFCVRPAHCLLAHYRRSCSLYRRHLP
jgi:aminopeptidase 2